jgi:hypothetical protein
MTAFPILLLAVVAGLWYLSTKIMKVTVDALASPRERMEPRTHAPADQDMRGPLRLAADWAFEHGFEEDVMFDFRIADRDQTLFCKTWKSAAEKTYLVFYSGLGRHVPDAHTLPTVPGAFVQSFPGLTPDQLLDMHHTGRATLERRTGLEPQDRPEETADLIAAALERQARYVMSIPGWQWKGLWWITVRTRQMIGRDVGWQLDRFGVHEPPEGLQ